MKRGREVKVKFCKHCESLWKVGIVGRLKPSVGCLFGDEDKNGCPFCGAGYYHVESVEVNSPLDISVPRYTGTLPQGALPQGALPQGALPV